jgi:hypothetical protein
MTLSRNPVSMKRRRCLFLGRMMKRLVGSQRNDNVVEIPAVVEAGIVSPQELAASIEKPTEAQVKMDAVG